MPDDDLIALLRAQCSCNIETAPCGAEEECRLFAEAAAALAEKGAEIERLTAVRDDMAAAVIADTEALRARLAAAEKVVEAARLFDATKFLLAAELSAYDATKEAPSDD